MNEAQEKELFTEWALYADETIRLEWLVIKVPPKKNLEATLSNFVGE